MACMTDQAENQVGAVASVVAEVENGGSELVNMASLFVGDLEVNVNDYELYDLFSQAGHVISVRVCRDFATRRSLGYGYVNYNTAEEAARALEMLNCTLVNNKKIRVMYSLRNPIVRKSGAGNIFIKNLDKTIDHKALHDTFSTFGNILSSKVEIDTSGQSKGYGFVQFDNEESAKKAIDNLNGMLINDKQVYVGHFVRKHEREAASSNAKFTNVYVKNLAKFVTDDDLKKIFCEFGPTTSAVVMKNADGDSKCFGFVNFRDANDAAKAVEVLNGKKFGDKEWYVGRAQKKSEREIELKHKFEQNVRESAGNPQRANLYIKNLHDSIDDDKLKELFSSFGIITSCKVMRDTSGVSKGSGFVAFSTTEEANQALAEMNGKMVIRKSLYVAPAQKKEERRAKLENQFAQIPPVIVAPPFGPRLPLCPPGAPRAGQHFFYGRGPPIFPPWPEYGYPQQILPGMRPAGASMPNLFVPIQQGPQDPLPGGRPLGVLQQTQPISVMQQQMHPRGHFYRYPAGRGILEAPMPMVAGIPSLDVANPLEVRIEIAHALVRASPEDHRMILGEELYPLVEQLEPEMVGKVTGMLLEMDQTEVLHLIESPEALKEKVAEAIEVLKSAAQREQAGDVAD